MTEKNHKKKLNFSVQDIANLLNIKNQNYEGIERFLQAKQVKPNSPEGSKEVTYPTEALTRCISYLTEKQKKNPPKTKFGEEKPTQYSIKKRKKKGEEYKTYFVKIPENQSKLEEIAKMTDEPFKEEVLEAGVEGGSQDGYAVIRYEKIMPINEYKKIVFQTIVRKTQLSLSETAEYQKQRRSGSKDNFTKPKKPKRKPLKDGEQRSLF